jgi:hypothetical protein
MRESRELLVSNLLGDFESRQKRDWNRLDLRNIAIFGLPEKGFPAKPNIPQESYQHIANASHLRLPCEVPQSLDELSSIPHQSTPNLQKHSLFSRTIWHVGTVKRARFKSEKKPLSKMIIYS